ncbi:NAC domain-containing protein 78 [Hibiscus syriacus]|uniref:NAC domain-containing protein 78 n=1 Tax=Hibiscus syriacus TaxID=106335 RepID=A0A6A2YD32_HIBSY|nr:NAC domain containing protein 50-like [Hibiscus syriacus]KAE8669874.1 NAC domain-containing protein 78 [Hibiscus syriacus]
MRGEKSLAIVASPSAAAETRGSATALAPGFRFHPTDEELASYYLTRKVSNRPVRFNAIAEVDIYKHEPWDLSDKSRLKTRDQEWYFFSLLDKKYGNGGRMNRATNQGYWKATGKDREVRHNGQLIGMKKTLVFHNGRAPDGLRTNWVMHEYRLVEEEFERIGALQGYVLCRVFHKNNIGPPNGNRYAPFIEAEWDDGSEALVPGVDVGDDDVDGNNLIDVKEVAAAKNAVIASNGVQRISFEQEIQNADEDVLDDDEGMRKSPNERTDVRPSLTACKMERSDKGPSLCLVNREAPLPLIHYKRRRQNDSGPNHENVSENSTRATQDHCSSTTTAVTTTMSPSSDTTTAVSALLEFSLMESRETREKKPRVPPPIYETANLDSMLPPGCMKLIKELQDEVRKISAERETLKLEMMSAQAMVNILQSRLDFLIEENEDLKGRNRGGRNGRVGSRSHP